MTDKPENLYEAASYDLNQFRERRMADRRAQQRDTPDRRKGWNGGQRQQEAQHGGTEPSEENRGLN